MNAERTYSIISKYIAETNGVTIKFERGTQPIVNLDTKVITIPSNLKDDTIYAGLAALMHEAAHIKHTPNDMAKAVVDDETDMHILNAIEDTRIDKLNFRKLPNIKAFYKDLMNDTYNEIKDRIDKLPFEVRVLSTCIGAVVDIPFVLGRDAEDFVYKHRLPTLFREASHCIDYKMYPDVKKTVKKIRALLFPPPPPTPPPKPDGSKDKPDDDDCKDSPTPSDTQQGDKPQQGDQQNEQGNKPGDQSTPDGDKQQGDKPQQGDQQNDKQGKKEDLSEMSGITDYSKVFKNIDKDKKDIPTVGSVALKNQTKQRFTDILNIKENKIVNDGLRLNTDSLVSFFTGDIEELFVDDKTTVVKKSKIIFVLDASCSMVRRMVDGQHRVEV